MRRLLPLVAAAVLLAGCAGDDDPPVDDAEVHLVAIHGGDYDPQALQMPAGDTLRFESHEAGPHTATAVASPMGDLESGDLGEGERHDFEGMEPGTYSFRCRHHPDMRVTVTVA